MSYYREEGKQSPFRADRLPVYIFPAFVGSGRMLLGMTLAGLMTAVIMHSSATANVSFWWLAALVYLSSVIMMVTGIYAINTEPQPRPEDMPQPDRPPPRSVAGRVFTPPTLIGPEPAMPQADLAELRERLGDLLVKEWGLLDDQQLERAHSEQEKTGQSLVHVLGRLGMLSDEDLERILEVRSAALDPWHDSPRHD